MTVSGLFQSHFMQPIVPLTAKQTVFSCTNNKHNFGTSELPLILVCTPAMYLTKVRDDHCSKFPATI